MDVDDVKLTIENTEKTALHRNRNADRSLKLDDVIYRIHKQLFERIPALTSLVKDGDRTLLKLDYLKREQVHFTPCGLDMVLDWIYGKRIEFTPLQLTDALAAAFALETYDMVEAIEKSVITVSDDRSALMILLYHVDNFSPETRKHLLTSAGARIKELSDEFLFTACPFHIFKRLIKAATRELGSSLNAVDIIQAILIWGSENTNNEMTLSLLNMIPISNLQSHKFDALRDMARKYGLEHSVEAIFDRQYYKSMLAPHTANLNETYGVEEIRDKTPVRRTTDEHRIAAGKNAVETSNTQEEEQVPLERTAIMGASEDHHVVRKVMNSAKRVHFGAVDLEKQNDLKIEITYNGEKEAAKNEPVKLYFDVEIDPPNDN